MPFLFNRHSKALFTFFFVELPDAFRLLFVLGSSILITNAFIHTMLHFPSAFDSVTQMEMREQQIIAELHEMAKPLARHVDDADYNKVRNSKQLVVGQ